MGSSFCVYVVRCPCDEEHGMSRVTRPCAIRHARSAPSPAGAGEGGRRPGEGWCEAPHPPLRGTFSPVAGEKVLGLLTVGGTRFFGFFPDLGAIAFAERKRADEE